MLAIVRNWRSRRQFSFFFLVKCWTNFLYIRRLKINNQHQITISSLFSKSQSVKKTKNQNHSRWNSSLLWLPSSLLPLLLHQHHRNHKQPLLANKLTSNQAATTKTRKFNTIIQSFSEFNKRIFFFYKENRENCFSFFFFVWWSILLFLCSDVFWLCFVNIEKSKTINDLYRIR